mgnify:CR=1 FL=1
MCGIFGVYASDGVLSSNVKRMATLTQSRGTDSSGLTFLTGSKYQVTRSEAAIRSLLEDMKVFPTTFVGGHGRMATHGEYDNQPLTSGSLVLMHNGIVINSTEVWNELGVKPKLSIDSEIILFLAQSHFEAHGGLEGASRSIFSRLSGAISMAILSPTSGEILIASNTGSMHYSQTTDKTGFAFASEYHTLERTGYQGIQQLRNGEKVFEIPKGTVSDLPDRNQNVSSPLLSAPNLISSERKLLIDSAIELKRCSKCILPESMPFICFDDKGICNYCTNYKTRLADENLRDLEEILEPARQKKEKIIVPFSGGRDSSYALHYLAKELRMEVIAYTYDWGMVTDLGRRNISRMTAALGAEDMLVAANIRQKRRNVALNLKAWLKNPDVSMLSLLTAGDKHFFKYVNQVKQKTGAKINVWGINPLETTHFKTGVLGLEPDFGEKRVYSSKSISQIRFQSARFKRMLRSPGYFNRSLFDTLSGEYYRTYSRKEDYYHFFDYMSWNEEEINQILLSEYNWETDPETSTTWRIGDATAAFYNYVYFLALGFTENDTLRSNQIREGIITRADALAKVEVENAPRYESLKWYLDVIGFDFTSVIETVNQLRRTRL